MMKKLKSLLALLLALCLLLTLMACTKQQENTADNAENAAVAEPEASESDASDSEAETAAAETEEPEEPVEVIFWVADVYAHGADHLDRLSEAVNAITEPNGVHADLNFITVGDFVAKAQTSLMSGERVDLMCYSVTCGILNMMKNNLALDITDELNTYAAETMELMQDYLGPYTYNGRVYGLPTLRSYVTNGYFCFNQELLDGAGLTELASNMTTWSEFEQVLQGLYDAYAADGIYPISASLGTMLASNSYYIHGDNFSDIEVVDTLGDTVSIIYTDSDGNVSNGKAKEEYVAACKTAKEWLEKGWLHPDGVYDSLWRGDDAIVSGVAASEVISSEVGVESTKTMRYGAQALCVKEYTGMIQTSTLTGWGIGVPNTCEEPEAACKLINMLYTNEDLMRIFVNGIEGEDYNIVDGEAVQVDSMFSQGNFIMGNNFLTVPLQGSGADLYEVAEAENNAATRSAYLGFTIDTSELDLVISQISAVNDQYTCFLACGAYTDEDYEAYLAKLEEAGVQDYLNAIQTQLDAWAAEQ